MPVRVWTIALNTYREAVRARILHGLFALALATTGYSLVVGQYTARNALRVVSDLGAAAVSLYAVVVAVVLGVRNVIDSELLQILVGGALSCLAYALVVFPMRHEILGVLRKRADA